MTMPTTMTTSARHGQEQEHAQLPMRHEPFFPRASQKELYTEMDRCAALLRIETQKYNRALASPSSNPSTTSSLSNGPDHAQELYGAMMRLANHLQQVTHDLHFHHHRGHRLAKATRLSSASLAPTKKTIQKRNNNNSARRCEHCGQTTSAAWRRGPDYCQLCNRCGLRYQANSKMIRSMSVQAVLN